MTRRNSITKLQRRTAAAVELIALSQTITADGRLTDDEIVALKQHGDRDRVACGCSNGMQIRFVPETHARDMADELDSEPAA